MKKISEIKEELQAAKDDMLPVFVKEYESDERSGVQALVAKAHKRMEALEHEIARTEQMKKYEKFFKTADGKQKALEKKNADLSAALEESEKESTVKKLQEMRLHSDYERIKGILDRIPPEIIKVYTHRSTQKHDIHR